MKAFPGAKARPLNHHTIPLLEDNTYHAAAIRVVINDLVNNVNSTKAICKDIIDIDLWFRNNNISVIVIWGIAYSYKVNPASIQ